jgi:hypothetical protein
VQGIAAPSDDAATAAPNPAPAQPADRRAAVAIALGFVAAVAFSVWVISPRFPIRVPSAVDDWGGASEPDMGIGDLLGPFFESPSGRFRPAWELYDHLQWHTLGAPAMTGPNIWNLVRIVLFVAAVGLVPALLYRARLRPLTLFALTLLPAVLLLGGPAVAVDFARLGPQEPILVGAVVCGGALVLYAADRLVAGRWGRRAVAALLAGWPLFVFGLFFKEASIAYFAALAGTFLFLLGRWRERGLMSSWREPLRDWRLVAIGLSLLVPMLWFTYRVAGTGGEGVNLYGHGAPHGLSGWIDRARDAWNLQWNSISAVTGSSLWRGLGVALPLLAAGIWLDRRRAPWLVIGFALTGYLMLVIQGLPGVVVSRYFIPTMAMFTIAMALGLAEARAWLRVTAIAAAVIVAVSGAQPAHDATGAWARDEQATSAFVDYTARLVHDRCTLEMTGLDEERSYSFPQLVMLRAGGLGRGPCPIATRALVATLVGSAPSADPSTYTGLWAACRSPWSVVFQDGIWALLRCDNLAKQVQGAPTAGALGAYRLVPGVGERIRQACLQERHGDQICDRPRLNRNDVYPP